MTAAVGPRADSRAYKVMLSLAAAGGERYIVKLRNAYAPTLSPSEFHEIVLARLLSFGYIVVRDASVSITDAGRCYLNPPPVEASAPAVLVLPPYRKPRQDLVKRARQLPIRDGAFEYRDIPSRHGDQRIAFKPGFPDVGAAQG